MSTLRRFMVALTTGFFLLPAMAAQAQTPQGTAFTYQGRLTDGGAPANGAYDFQITLFDSVAGGAQVPGTPVLTLNDVTVTGGLFTVSLDFGGTAFAGSKRWLDIGVRPGASTGGYTPLTARQELTPAPGAVFSQTAPWTGISGKPAGFADNVDNDVLGGLTCPTGQVAKSNGSGWACGTDTDSGGDITAVTAGSGLTGGATSGNATLTINFGGTGSAPMVAHADHEHLGQTWTGSTSSPGLFVTNTLPDFAAIGLRGSAIGYGVWGDSANGIGVYGSGAFGMRGESSFPGGRGVYGVDTSTTGFASDGVFGQSASTAGRGTVGYATATAGTTYGVWGQSDSTSGRGVYGLASAASGTTYGVYGESAARDGYGVYGLAPGINGIGVYGSATAADLGSNNVGVFGRTTNIGGAGVLGQSPANGIAIQASGGWGIFGANVQVFGTLSKGGGSFKIDHPLDPANKYLYHSFVESPDMKNIYDGVVTTDPDGYATVELPEWFEVLNRDFRYQLTIIDPDDGAGFVLAKVVREVRGNQFRIRTSAPGTRVSWQVTGIRKDPFAEKHRIPIEEDKPADERGTYLHPTEWGQAQEAGLDYKRSPVRER
jgi:hypothetical protein